MTVRIFLKKLSSENGRKFIRSASKIVHERSGHLDVLSYLLAIAISRQYLLLWTDMLHNTVGWCSVLVTFKSLYNLFWSLQSANYIQLSWTENLWNIMSNLYCSCNQLLLIYRTDLFTSVIELTIIQHSVWQYRIVRRSNLLQDQFNNRCPKYMYVYWVVPPKNSSTWVNNNKYMYFSNTQGHPLSIFRKYLFGWRFEI